MLGVTLFGLMLTPVFYVILRKLSGVEHLVDKHGKHPHLGADLDSHETPDYSAFVTGHSTHTASRVPETAYEK
jgi:multidrug efflux pump